MGYGYNNNNYGNRRYNNRNSYNGPYPNRQPFYGPQNRPAPKKSGAVYSKIKKGNFEGFTIVNAWNKSRSKGLITAKVSPYKNSDTVHKSKTSGKEYMPMMCEITYEKTGNKMLFPCLMNVETRKIVLDKVGMIISPNGSGQTSSGKRVQGYFGTMFRR